MSRPVSEVVVAVAVALVLSSCGVSSQEEPQLIEESTQPTATPSFESETNPPPSSHIEPATSAPIPSGTNAAPSGGAPGAGSG